MAEERLIDTDKDKKYRIRVNDDGEEELIVDDEQPLQAEQEEVEVTFAVDGDEDATDEQSEILRRQEEEERAERQRKLEELLNSAKSECSLYRYATALEYLEKAEEIDDENGEIYALKLVAYTRNFTDYSQIITAAESADEVFEYTSPERKAELLEKGAPSLEDNIAKLRSTVSELNRQNEEKKAERAVKFNKDRNTAMIIFFCIFAVFAVFASLTGYFASIIYSVSTGKYLILTCVMGAIALIVLFALAFAARRLNITCRRVRMNKRNTTTQLGRDLLSEQAKLRAFIAVYSALKGEK